MYKILKCKIGHIMIASLALTTFGRVAVPMAAASELGHYAPSVYKPRDFFVPPEGSYVSLIQLYYTADTYRDKDGDRVNELNVGGITINIDADVDSYMTLPTYIRTTQWDLLGADYAFMVVPMFGNISFQAALEVATNPEFGLEIDDSSFGLGDTYIRPLWLGWDLGKYQVSTSYGVYVPIGKYRAGAADNVGLGMWSHEFQVAGAWYLDEQRGTALTGAMTYEVNHNKKDVDIRPGSHFTLNLGASQYLPISENTLGEVSAFGYMQRQMTKDKGLDAFNKDVKDQVYGMGLQGSLIYLPWSASFSFHWMHEFKAEDRFEGDFFQISATFPF